MVSYKVLDIHLWHLISVHPMNWLAFCFFEQGNWVAERKPVTQFSSKQSSKMISSVWFMFHLIEISSESLFDGVLVCVVCSVEFFFPFLFSWLQSAIYCLWQWATSNCVTHSCIELFVPHFYFCWNLECTNNEELAIFFSWHVTIVMYAFTLWVYFSVLRTDKYW